MFFVGTRHAVGQPSADGAYKIGHARAPIVAIVVSMCVLQIVRPDVVITTWIVVVAVGRLLECHRRELHSYLA